MKIFIKRFLGCFLLMISLNSCGQNNDENKIEEVVEIIPENSYPASDLVISTHSDWTRAHYPKRIAEFKQNPLAKNDIVFLGNSITEQGEDWSVKVNNSKAKNRGIAGDTTEGVLARLGEIIYFKPDKIFILIGINDAFHNIISAEKIHTNILEIVTEINKNNPNTEIFVQTVLPTTTDSLIPKIKQINVLLENYEATKPYKLIKLHQHFVVENGKMNMNFSTDGVHLNDKGYEVWSEIIKNIL